MCPALRNLERLHHGLRAVGTYTVSAVKTLSPTSVDEVQNSGYDLVLYTCTYGGATRVAVFCDRVEDEYGS